MNTELPSRIDSGIRLTPSGPAHRIYDRNITFCGERIGDGAENVSDLYILIHRISKCRECWRPDGDR